MEAIVTIKASPSDFDTIRDSLRQSIEAEESIIEANRRPTSAEARAEKFHAVNRLAMFQQALSALA